jgi:formylglycine-generating enzyme required for sulfatase activity
VSFLIFISCGAGVGVEEFTVYQLTITNNGHGTTDPSGIVKCDHGVATNIEATPDYTYTFVDWTVTSGAGVTFGNAYSASTTVTLTEGDATIQANFYQDVFQLTVTDDGNGSTFPSGNVMVADGVPAAITANPDSGYGFANWSIEGGTGVTFSSESSAVTTVTLTVGDATIQANFTPLPTAVESPTNDSVIDENTSIEITFNKTMNTATLNLRGDLASESNGGVWSTTTVTDDTLTISPATVWTGGSGLSLIVDCDDLFGHSLSTLALSYTIPRSIELITINAANDSFTMGDGTYGPDVAQIISYNYQISKYETTHNQYAQFISDGGYSTSSYWTTNGWNYKESQGWTEPAFWTDFNGVNQPVVGVSWYEAVAFCNWLSSKEGLTQAYDSSGQATLTASGYRLPTEVEWEYAAAKGDSEESERIYAYGDTWDCTEVVSGVSPCSATQTSDVGSKSPTGDTPQGLADMSGNVAEWCSDNWQPDGSVSADTDRYYFWNDQDSANFVCRGGSWYVTYEQLLRGSERNDDTPSPISRVHHNGFRVVRP